MTQKQVLCNIAEQRDKQYKSPDYECRELMHKRNPSARSTYKIPLKNGAKCINLFFFVQNVW